MSITARVFAVGPDIATLEASIATLITAGKQPNGPVIFLNGQYAQAMDAGSGSGSIDDVSALGEYHNTEEYTADGAIALTGPRIKVISKTSAAAMTLAAPTDVDDDGKEITLIAGTAFAHVITATNLLDDGTTGGPHDTCTLGAFVGASATFVAWNGRWVLKSKSVATIAG